MPYLKLMDLAGYLDEPDLAELEARAPKPHPLAGRVLTADEWREVGDFIDNLLARRDSSR